MSKFLMSVTKSIVKMEEKINKKFQEGKFILTFYG